MKQAWNEVAEGFASLGRKITDRYHGEPPEPQESEAGGHEPEPAAALREAFDRLINAALDLGDRAVAVVRDDEIKTQAKRAANSLNEAIGATVDMIGDEISGLFRRPVSEPAPAPPVEATASDAEPAPEEPSEDPPPAP